MQLAWQRVVYQFCVFLHVFLAYKHRDNDHSTTHRTYISVLKSMRMNLFCTNILTHTYTSVTILMLSYVCNPIHTHLHFLAELLERQFKLVRNLSKRQRSKERARETNKCVYVCGFVHALLSDRDTHTRTGVHVCVFVIFVLTLMPFSCSRSTHALSTASHTRTFSIFSGILKY